MTKNNLLHFPETPLAKALRAVQNYSEHDYEMVAYQNGKRIINLKGISYPSFSDWKFMGLDVDGKEVWHRTESGTQWIATNSTTPIKQNTGTG